MSKRIVVIGVAAFTLLIILPLAALYLFNNEGAHPQTGKDNTLRRRPAGPATPPISGTQTPSSSPDPQVGELRMRLSALRPQLGFTPAAPSDLAGLEPIEPLVNGPTGAPFVNLLLFESGDRRQRIAILQSATGFGTVASLRDRTSVETVTVWGVPAQLERAPASQTNSASVQLVFQHGRLFFVVTAWGIPLERVLTVVNSFQDIP